MPQAFTKAESGGFETPVPDAEIGVSVGHSTNASRQPSGASGPRPSASSATAAAAMPAYNTWKIEPASGFLPPRGQVKAVVSFVPCNPFKYVLPLTLMLDGKEDPYIQFSALVRRMFFVFAELGFDNCFPNHVCFPFS